MTARNRDIPPALPCGGDPLVRTCGLDKPLQTLREAALVDAYSTSSRHADLCRACLPRPQGLVKLEVR